MSTPTPPTVRHDGLFRGSFNRILQMIAREAPGASSLRVRLHRLRGVTIGEGSWIGYDCVLETSYPYMIRLGNRVTLSVRVTVVAHFGTTSGVVFEDDVFVGPCATILPGVTIGHGAVIAAGSVVNRSVPPKTIYQGNPGRFVATCEVPLTNNVPMETFMRGYRPIRSRRTP